MGAQFPKTMVDLKPGDHLCFLYETDEEYWTVLIAFLRQGLERGEKVLYVTDARPAETILGRLQKSGLDPEPYLTSGQFVILTTDDVYLKGGRFEPKAVSTLLQEEVERALAEGYSALRITGEMTWILWGPPGSEQFSEYEREAARFFHDNPCLTLCQYDRRLFGPTLLLDALRTHPMVVIGTDLYDNFYYTPATELVDGDRSTVMLQRWVENLVGHKQAEEALKESEGRLSGILSSMADLVFAFDAEGRFTFHHSPQVEDLYVPPEVFIGRKYSEVMPAYMHRLLAHALEQNRQGEVTAYEYWLEIGAETRWFCAKLSPVFKEGEFTGSVAVIRDITGHKQVEKELRRISEELEDRVEEKVEELAKVDQELQIEISEHKQVEARLQNLSHVQEERVEPLDCLFRICDLYEEHDTSLERVFQGLVELVPLAWRYPEVASARIVLGEQTFSSGNFHETPWMQTEDIRVQGDVIGQLQVCYLETVATAEEDLFLGVERDLIGAIAQRLGQITEGKKVI